MPRSHLQTQSKGQYIVSNLTFISCPTLWESRDELRPSKPKHIQNSCHYISWNYNTRYSGRPHIKQCRYVYKRYQQKSDPENTSDLKKKKKNNNPTRLFEYPFSYGTEGPIIVSEHTAQHAVRVRTRVLVFFHFSRARSFVRFESHSSIHRIRAFTAYNFISCVVSCHSRTASATKDR